MQNRETPAGAERKGWSIRPLTRCRNSIFETVKSKAKPWQTLARVKPQAEANSSSKGSVGHACETGKPQQDSSARGGQFVPRRAAETASSKPLRAIKTMANRGRVQAPSGSQFRLKGFCGACMRNKETSAGSSARGGQFVP